jgi:hypothetical protein
MRHHLLAGLALPLLLTAAGCSGADGSGGSPGREPTGTLASAVIVPSVSPCDPSWRLPTVDWPYLSPAPDGGQAFYGFEKRLYAGGSLWFGQKNPETGSLDRAIVDVTHLLAGDPNAPPKSALYYLALIPYVPPPAPLSDAEQAVVDDKLVKPVDSRILGYCLEDNSFLPNLWDAVGTRPPNPDPGPNHTILYSVTEYDPRCTCNGTETALTTATVGEPLYDSVPSL